MTSERGSQVRLELTREERLLMTKRFSLSPAIRSQVEATTHHPLEVWISVDEAEQLREQAGDLFQEIGLTDEKVTEDGRILDALIDKLFR